MGRWLSSLARTLLRPLWLAVLLGVCVAAAGAGYYFWSAAATDDLKRQALTAMDDRDFERARADLQAYVAARPGDAEGHFLLARACRRARVEDFEQAHHHLDEAHRLGFSGVDFALEAAMLDVQEKGYAPDNEATLRDYLTSEGPGEALVLEAMARGYIAQSRIEEANGCLNLWIERAPDDWYPHLWRGALLEYKHQPGLAVADFEFARNKRPADEAIGMRLGLALSQSGVDYKEALNGLEPYRRSHPDDVDAIVGVAQCRRMMQQADAAAALLEPVTAAHPDHIDALLTLALVESDRGDDADALERVRRAEVLARSLRETTFLGRLRRLEPTPNHTDAPHRMQMMVNLEATILDRLGRPDEARRRRTDADRVAADGAELTKALEEYHRSPQDVAVLDRLGVLYLRIGMAEEGVTVLERAVQQKADDPAAHQALAEYYESRDDPESRRLAEQHRRFLGPAHPTPQGPRDP